MKQKYKIMLLLVVVLTITTAITYLFFVVLNTSTTTSSDKVVTARFFDSKGNEIKASQAFSIVDVASKKYYDISLMIIDVNVKNTGDVPVILTMTTADVNADFRAYWIAVTSAALSAGESKTFSTTKFDVKQYEGMTKTFSITVNAAGSVGGSVKSVSSAASMSFTVSKDPTLGIVVTVGELPIAVTFTVSDPVASPSLYVSTGEGLDRSSKDVSSTPPRVAVKIRKTFTILPTVDLSKYSAARLEVFGNTQSDKAFKADVFVNSVDVYSDSTNFYDFIKAGKPVGYLGWYQFTDTNVKSLLRIGDNSIEITLYYDMTGRCLFSCASEPPDVYPFMFTSENGYTADSNAWGYWLNGWDSSLAYAYNMRIVFVG